MKKLILFAAVLFGINTGANAQISDGNILVGGNLANFTADINTQTSLAITPKAAWFIKDGLAVGAYVNLGFTHPSGGQTTFNYGFGPMARYYMANEVIGNNKKTVFFWEANVGFDGSSLSKKGNLAGNSTNGLGFGVGPGLSYFITPNIGLEALVKYNGIVGFGNETYKNRITVGFGFQIYLPSSKAKSAVKNF